MRTRYLVVGLTAAACGLMGSLALAGLAGSASAASGGESPRHCVMNSETKTQQCFDNYREAINFASNGKITDAPLDAHASATDQQFQGEVKALAAKSAQATTDPGTVRTLDGGWVIGATVFADKNFSGDTLTLMLPSPCAKDGHYDREYSSTDLGGLNQNIESVQAWANCWIWLHDGPNVDGTREGPYKDMATDLGVWDNRAQSIGLS